MKSIATFCITALVAYVSAQAEPESSVSSMVESVTSTVLSITAVISDTSVMVGTPTGAMTTASATVPMTPVQSCVARCNPGDTNCQAVCVAVPNPNESQVNQTTECVARCPQGSGSQADTEAYTICRDNCINSIYLSSRSDLPTSMSTGVVGVSTSMTTSMTTTGTVVTTGRTMTTVTSGSATGTGSTASASGTNTRSGTSSSGTGTATAATSSPTGAAAHNKIGAPLVGLAGIVAAVFAL